jgi:hypothetical protein
MQVETIDNPNRYQVLNSVPLKHNTTPMTGSAEL